jgi:hypothetical protein
MKYCYIFSFLFFCSCTEIQTEKKILGTYVPIGYKNTFDTITLMIKGNYQRKVYDKFNRLALSTTGRWKIDARNSITFKSFFLNFDRDVAQYPELLKDTSMELSVNLSKKDDSFYFCTGYYDDESCYIQKK